MAAPTGILAMLAKPKGKGGSEKSGPPEPGGDDYKDDGGEVASALGDMFAALKAGKNDEAALAFKRAKVACEDEEADEDMSDMGAGDEDDNSDEE